ncbi:hypothetical protein AG1IA_06494 [Rhizoctonia solani AG-1 IA]|uniref:Uncharacterized protein n=1 Tax=Thanatephorus cucumeris (strain AG1-IA) TaxID=983506 RepID=L8WMU5_THACA|nr:hypothetical protein AG1IA_06494 [Rhizoctonia solani AG-1 IA]
MRVGFGALLSWTTWRQCRSRKTIRYHNPNWRSGPGLIALPLRVHLFRRMREHAKLSTAYPLVINAAWFIVKGLGYVDQRRGHGKITRLSNTVYCYWPFSAGIKNSVTGLELFLAPPVEMAIDHVSNGSVSDLQASKVFYEKALAPLADFWLSGPDPNGSRTGEVKNTMHIAFAGTRAQVHAFHEAAIQGSSILAPE